MNGLRGKLPLVLGVASLILAWRVHALYVKYTPPQAEASLPSVEAQPEALPELIKTPRSPVLLGDESLWQAQRAATEQPWDRDPFAIGPWVTDLRGAGDAVDSARLGEPRPPTIAFCAVCGCGENWLAVVRGNIVRVGDVIDKHYRVSRIAKGSLTLTGAGCKFHYELGTNNVVVEHGAEE